jgi:undecaprenyl-diphosphatase
VIIGLAQSLAVVPGVSRAGIVMLSMMGMGFKRSESALYSFLLAVPTIMAASVYDLYKSRDILVASSTSLAPLMIGFVTAFAVAYVSVKWLIGYLQHHSLVPFGFYRIALAILVMLFVAR